MITPAGESVINLLLNPGHLILGGWDYVISWFSTRRWLNLLIMLPPVGLLLFVLIAATVGSYRDRESVLLDYWTRIEGELVQASSDTGESSGLEGSEASSTSSTAEGAADSDGPEAPSVASSDSAQTSKMEADNLEAMAGNKISPYLEMLLLRVLDVDTSNVRATYWVARHLGAGGRQGQARWMMRKIAGEKIAGFAPAHAWLAADRMTNLGIKSREDQLQLIHDLQIASSWDGASSQLVVALANLLAQEGKIAEAIRQLEQAAQKEPRLWLQVAELAKKANRNEVFERAAANVRSNLQPRFDAQTAKSQDFISLAFLEGLERDFDAAIRLSTQALQLEPNNATVRRILSEVYLSKYSVAENANAKIDLLDAALKADGTNPLVTNEIARLISTGQTAPPRLVRALEEKLANGQASSLTHLLLANRHLLETRYQEAIGHLEIAFKMSPTSPIVMNNLALALVRSAPSDTDTIQRAEDLLARALQVTGPNAELLDSMGEVRAIRATHAGHIGAIECFEAAIGLEPNRIGTRERLVTSYRAVGLTDMAAVQEKKIAETKVRLETADAPAANSSSSEQTNAAATIATPGTNSSTGETLPPEQEEQATDQEAATDQEPATGEAPSTEEAQNGEQAATAEGDSADISESGSSPAAA